MARSSRIGIKIRSVWKSVFQWTNGIRSSPRVMAGLVPAIHIFVSTGKVVGARATPGHDTEKSRQAPKDTVMSRHALILMPMRSSRAMTGGSNQDGVSSSQGASYALPRDLRPGVVQIPVLVRTAL